MRSPVVPVALAVELALALMGCHKPERHYKEAAAVHDPTAVAVDAVDVDAVDVNAVDVEPRTPLLLTHPCSRCHANLPRNPEQRTLVKFHVVRNKELHHGDSKAWCYHCHSLENIDRLVTANGTLVTFDEAYLLCGSCHGDKLRDWNLQVHGKTMGHWRGPKLRRSCTGCHNPHRPAFQPLTPENAPIPPERVESAFMGGQMR